MIIYLRSTTLHFHYLGHFFHPKYQSLPNLLPRLEPLGKVIITFQFFTELNNDALRSHNVFRCFLYPEEPKLLHHVCENTMNTHHHISLANSHRSWLSLPSYRQNIDLLEQEINYIDPHNCEGKTNALILILPPSCKPTI